MADQATYGANNISFNEWKISEDDVNNHLHFFHNGNQKCQFTEDGLESGDVSFDPTGTNLTSTNIRSAVLEVETHTDNQTQSIGSGSLKLIYNSDTNTSDSQPANGKFRFNNSTAASVTKMFISNIEKSNGVNIRNLLLLAQNSDLSIYAQKADDNSVYRLYSANGIDSSDPNYLKFENLTLEETSGSMVDNKKFILVINKKTGHSLMNKSIPSLPTSGTNWILQYNYPSDSFSWVAN